MYQKDPEFKKSFRRKFAFSFWGNVQYTKTEWIGITSEEFIHLSLEVIKNLGWIITYRDDSSITAINREGGFWKQQEKIRITYEKHEMTVCSSSNDSISGDLGRNSKRVQLFIFGFRKEKQKYSEGELSKAAQETLKLWHWGEYQVPDTLPSPADPTDYSPYLSFLGAILLPCLVGVLIAWLEVTSEKTIFIILWGVSFFVLNKVFELGIKHLDLKEYKAWHQPLIVCTISLCMSTLYFYYFFAKVYEIIPDLSFLEYLQWRWQGAFPKEFKCLAGYWWLGSWLIIGYTYYYISELFLFLTWVLHLEKRVPEEVLQYARYLIYQNKDEGEIREALFAKGWKTEEQLDDVFEALDAQGELKELGK